MPDHGRSENERVTQVFARHLNWSAAQIEAEQKLYADHLALELAWQKGGVVEGALTSNGK